MTAPPAAGALVFMVMCVESCDGVFSHSWPVWHRKANLIHRCLLLLADVGVRIISLPYDGPSCHMSMLKELGASLNPDQ